jgi:hypothetical protein
MIRYQHQQAHINLQKYLILQTQNASYMFRPLMAILVEEHYKRWICQDIVKVYEPKVHI